MSAKRISQVVVGRDGQPRRRLPNGRLVPLKGKTAWKHLDGMPEGEVITPARTFLLVIDREPRAVERALTAGS